MRLEKGIFLFDEVDVIDIANFYLSKENIKIKSIKFIDNDIEAIGNIKKIFNLEFNCKLSVSKGKDDKICINIKDIKALKVNLFSIIEKVANKYSEKGIGKYITIEGDNIYLDLFELKKKIDFINFSIKNIEVKNNALNIEFDTLDMSLAKFMNLNYETAKEINNSI